MRGGTSKGLFFDARDLPTDTILRDKVLLAAMGSPDIRQIDGLGGAHPLTSKVAIINSSARDDADVDYLFQQVVVDKAEVSGTQNCGNILAGVGPWAIENGYVTSSKISTNVRIHMVNTNSIAEATIETPDGVVNYTGNTQIDGVPETSAPILLDFKGIAGSSCGSLLPTGKAIDTINGVRVTCIDNGMPVILIKAEDFGLSGRETPAELEENQLLKNKIEAIRLIAGPKMNLGNVSNKTVPKMTLVAKPVGNGLLSTRSFIPHRVHDAIGVLAAVSVATASKIPNSIAHEIAHHPAEKATKLDIEHPTGSFSVDIAIKEENGEFIPYRSALMRTARKLMKGEVYIPSSIWDGKKGA
jgi:4-oxalomesaconate tautomerase